jgi:hypothetical protein
MVQKLSIFLALLTFVTIFVFIQTSNAANIVGMWLMDEGNGEKIKDSSGKNHAGDFFGKPEWTNGKFGKGIKLHGSPDHIEISDPDNSLAPKHITMVAWVNMDNVSGSHSILEQYDWVAGLGTHCFRTVEANVTFTPVWGVDSIVCQGGVLKAGQWMHVAATYDGKDAKVWVNGEMVATGTDPQKRDLIPSNKTLSIGVRGDTKDIHWMLGTFDEIAIFDEALKENEIMNVMTKGLSIFMAVSPESKLSTAWGQIKAF